MIMKIYNSLTKQKEEFIPIKPKQVGIYVCGQTVYDYCHVGHSRKSIVFDMVRRWFISSGYQVTFVENITDIDDKIIKRANENNETINELTTRFINYMHEDFAKLGVLAPDVEPKATEYIEQMIEIIQGLLAKGFAYQGNNGDVYYKVAKFKNYGRLSGKSLSELRAGERVDIDEDKLDPCDFVLWKKSKANEPFWESPFGAGRPGWHIECSAMSAHILGKHFDIHGGGQDLQFPHHENEIAQSEAHNGCKFANYWMHNGFLNIDDEKMSKSLGNFFTVRDVLNQYPAEVVRFFMLRTHYRSPLNFSDSGLLDAKQGLLRIYQALRNFSLQQDLSNIDWKNEYALRFKQAMDDDFNTPLALSVLFELVNNINRNRDESLVNLTYNLAKSIGLLSSDALEFLQSGSELSAELIEKMIAKRNNARNNKDFELSDKIRDELLMHGIILEDKKNSTSWRKE